MEFSIFHIWKSGWNFTQLKMEFSIFYIWKCQCWIYLMKYWTFCISLYENLYAEFLTWNMVFSILHIWKSGWWLPYIKYGNLYISQMKIMALVFFRYGEPICYWSYLYFTNENMCTTDFSWNMEFFVFLTHTKIIFCHEIWNSLYFLFQNLGANTLS